MAKKIAASGTDFIKGTTNEELSEAISSTAFLSMPRSLQWPVLFPSLPPFFLLSWCGN